MRTHSLLKTSVLYLFLAALCSADPLLFQNPVGAPLGPGLSGVFDGQALGVRFSLADQAHITEIEAAFIISGGSLFAAIVELPSAGSVPTASLFLPLGDLSQVAAWTVFDSAFATTPTSINIPFGVTVAPGNYAVVIGTGMFGASGSGGLHGFLPDAGSNVNSLFWVSAQQPFPDGDGLWHDKSQTLQAFSINVYGTSRTPASVPENTSTLTLMLGGLLTISVLRKKQLTAAVRSPR